MRLPRNHIPINSMWAFLPDVFTRPEEQVQCALLIMCGHAVFHSAKGLVFLLGHCGLPCVDAEEYANFEASSANACVYVQLKRRVKVCNCHYLNVPMNG